MFFMEEGVGEGGINYYLLALSSTKNVKERNCIFYFENYFMTHLICVAPMMNCTDRHDRYFLRLIAPHVRLYTEMVVVNALAHRDPRRWLAFHPQEHPVALQLGGSDPKLLAYGAKLGTEFGYDEINLNVGCPSPRVSNGRFGACLMLEPNLVAESVASMKAVTSIPVTVKCRIGIDHQDSYEALHQFIEKVSQAGCSIFIIHARKAWLSGLNPKENRTLPPLQYEVVHRIKKDFPHLQIIINGGFKALAEIETELDFVDGVMIGRAAYSDPYFLSEIERKLFPGTTVRTREQVLAEFIPYLAEQLKNHIRLSTITRHILGLYRGQPGALAWRRYISEHAHKTNAGVEVLLNAPHGLAGSRS